MSRHLNGTILIAATCVGLAGTNSLNAADPNDNVVRRGFAKAIDSRPTAFPHRIWAACDFESRLPDYAWFGPAETTNIPRYPGNATALGVKERPYGTFSALMTGINPVPGPMMGAVNKMYCRYFLKGGTEATFQHFSLSSEDNNHIRVSGLAQGKWSELTINFTRDGQRNDGTPGIPFKKGERMDDLKVFVGKPDDCNQYDLYLDDIIFFDDGPDQPPVNEPFPKRVIFQAAFDTGIDPNSKPKYWPGDFVVLTKAGGAPEDSYWGIAKAVRRNASNEKWIRLQLNPVRSVGDHTKLRFRYYLQGAGSMTVQIFDATDNDNRHIDMKGLKQHAWQWAILDFTNDAKRNDGQETRFAFGHVVDDLFFFVRPESEKDVELFVDEVTMFDAGER